MSDISIPGVSNKYGTTDLIKGLMEVERKPLIRAQNELETYQSEKKIWQDVNRRMVSLRESVRNLYSFKNPFNERIAESSDETYLTATATRDAAFEKIKLSINKIATADRFLSRPLPKEYIVKKGAYTFTIGDKSVSFNWKGGSVKEFADSLTRRGNNLVKASVVGVSKTEQSLLIESLKTGQENALTFSQDAQETALDIGLIEKTPAEGSVEMSDATVPEQGQKIIPIASTVNSFEKYVFEYTIGVETRIDDSAVTTPPPGPAIPDPGQITFKGISVKNAAADIPIDEWQAPPIPPRVDNMSVLYVRTADGQRISLDNIQDGSEEKKYTVQLPAKKVTGIEVENTNTHRTIHLSKMKIYNPENSKGFRPINPVETAGDAEIKYQGITMKRDTNVIDDIVPGVTFTLLESSSKPLTVDVKPDTEASKNAIIEFVGRYNRILADINILTQTNPQIISELDYFTADEQATAESRLGTLQGDFTLNNIKTALQSAVNTPYRTGEDSTIQTLSQLGISTKAAGGGGINQSRLRGYLEIDEDILDEALKNHIPEIKNLFGFDSDGDLLVDNGIGFVVDAKIQPYVQTAGIMTMKNDTLDSKIKNTKSTIDRLDVQLARKEQDLKRKYGTMEGTLNSLQQQSTSLDNQMKQSQNQR